MDFAAPWHLTVIRTRGLLFVRPEKSWRPIVSLSAIDDRRDHDLQHEVMLGSDGQNPNLKSVVPINDVNTSTRIVVHVFHRSQTKKKHRKRTLVGSASVSIAEFLNKHPLPHPRPVDHDVRLSCPPPQRRSHTVAGKQKHSATLTIRFYVPQSSPPRPYTPPASPVSEHDAIFSDASSSRALSDTVVSSTPDPLKDDASWPKPLDLNNSASGLRRRRRQRPLRGFHIDSDSDAFRPGSSSPSDSDSDSCAPATPQDEFFPPIREDDDDECDGGWGGTEPPGGHTAVISPSVLPVHTGESGDVARARSPLSVVHTCVDRFAPFHELHEADDEQDPDKAERVLNRLLTEWYVVGASLLGLAGIDAAVFGFAPDAIFAVDGFSRSVVSIGAIAAGIGLVCDAWFLVLYSGASVTKFQRCAKDVYNSYFFFCLTCRLPTVCMFVSTLALMAFLLAVAWTAWPTAVLAMSFVAGLLLTSQFLVFGMHRFVNLVVWLVRVAWKRMLGAQAQAHVQHQHVGGPAEGRLEMPVPSPLSPPSPSHSHSPSPAAVAKMEMVWAEQHTVHHDRERAEGQ